MTVRSLRLIGDDGGMAALGAMICVVVLSCMLLVATTCADLLSARQHAAAAADVSALAAAPEAVMAPDAACARAQEIALANGARIVSCRVNNDEVLVQAAVTPRTSWARWVARLVATTADTVVAAKAQMDPPG